MPDASRTSVFRRILPSHLLGVGAASLAATALSSALVVAASSGSGASMPPVYVERDGIAPPPIETSSRTLIGLPGDVAIVDAELIGRAISFAERLAALPPPPPASEPVVEQPQSIAPTQQSIAPEPTVTTPPPAPTPPPPPPVPAVGAGLDTSPMSRYEQTLFDATNQRRASQGLAPLRPNGYLVGVARIRSLDMATNNYFAHTSPVTGDTAFSLMEAYNVAFDWVGENLAMNGYPLAGCVGVAEQALWDSTAHRENMLNSHYTDVGIGLRVRADGMCYFTILFSGARDLPALRAVPSTTRLALAPLP